MLAGVDRSWDRLVALLDLCFAERTRDVPELEKFFPAPRTARTPVGG